MHSIVTSKKVDGSWQALHVPSGRVTHGLSAEEANEAMRILLDMGDDGGFDDVPMTSGQFEGVSRDVAEFIEGEVSQMLALHSGYARLVRLEDRVAHIRMGGGCKGCPSSTLTLLNGVRGQLVDKFGEDVVADVCPAPEELS